MPFPSPKERAILTVNGQDYGEWETVQVKQALRIAPYYTFRMTCSEGQPIASNFQTMQIVPGDRCTITLAGQPAFNGLVYSRQVFYDAGKHYIEIQGASHVLDLSYSHVAHKTFEFNNKTVKQIADELCKPHGITFTEEGGLLPTDKIPNYNIAPGTTVHDAIETLMRSAGDAQLSSNLNSDLVAVLGSLGAQGTVREGFDILEGREIIFSPGIYKGQITATGQAPGTDQDWGATAAQKSSNAGGGSNAGRGLQQVIPLEMPAFTNKMLERRGLFDQAFQNRDEVTIYITLQGWLRPDGGLWESKKDVSVISPMLIMNGSEKLTCKSVTFTQDDNTGTRTVLELCNDLAFAPVPQGGGQP